MDDLLDDITGLVGICLLPEPDDSTDDIPNNSSEDEDSDEIIIVFCAIRTHSSSLIASIRTCSSFPHCIIMMECVFQLFLSLVYHLH